MKSMDYNLQTQSSTEEFRGRVERAVKQMTADDVSHIEIDGMLVTDEVVAKQFLDDPRYSHIGNDTVEGNSVHVFLFVHHDPAE
jgi:hypothetical protein